MATGKHKDYKVGNVVGTPTFLSLHCHSGASEYSSAHYEREWGMHAS